MKADGALITKIKTLYNTITPSLRTPDFTIFGSQDSATGEDIYGLIRSPLGSAKTIEYSKDIVYENGISKLLTAKPLLSTDTEAKHIKTIAREFSFNGQMFSIRHNIDQYDMQADSGLVAGMLNGITKTYDQFVFNGSTNPDNMGYYTHPNNLALAPLTISNIGDLTSSIYEMILQVATASGFNENELVILISGTNLKSYLRRNDNPTVNPAVTNLTTLLATFPNPIYEISPTTYSVDKISVYAPNVVDRFYQLDPEIVNIGYNNEYGYTYHVIEHGMTAINIKIKGGAMQQEVIVPSPVAKK